MRVEALTPAHVRAAIEVFLDLGYPRDQPVRPRADPAVFERDATLGDCLARFTKEDDGGQGARRFTLQYGNCRYFFSKLVLTEYLLENELFFAVDTHDNLPVSPNAPDYVQWLETKRHNRELKEQIERAWRKLDLPTFAQLRELCEELARIEREPRKGRVALVVDDERDIALAVAALLRGRGYDAEVAFDGAQVLQRLESDPLPDMALLDYELPDFDGGQLCQRLQGDTRLRSVRLVMATAAKISLTRLGPVHGFLRKPYPRSMLFALLGALFAGSSDSSGGNGRRALP